MFCTSAFVWIARWRHPMKQKPDVWNNGIAVITLFHSVAVHAQYVAYFSLHSATVVQLFRALEVWVVLGFSQFLRLPFSIDRWKFLGLLGMTGSVLIGHTGIDVVSGTAIAFANFFMPLRNLLTKLLMKHSAAEEIFNTFFCAYSKLFARCMASLASYMFGLCSCYPNTPTSSC